MTCGTLGLQQDRRLLCALWEALSAALVQPPRVEVLVHVNDGVDALLVQHLRSKHVLVIIAPSACCALHLTFGAMHLAAQEGPKESLLADCSFWKVPR